MQKALDKITKQLNAKISTTMSDKELMTQQKIAMQTEKIAELTAKTQLIQQRIATEAERTAVQKQKQVAMAQAETNLQERQIANERKKTAEAERQVRLRNEILGTSVGSSSLTSAAFGNTDELKSQMNALHDVNNAVVKLTGNQKILDGTYQTARVTIDQGNGQYRQFRYALDEASGSIYRLDQGLRTASRTSMTFGQNFMNITKKFAEWMLVATTVMLPIKAFQEGIQYVVQMDTAMTELSKVVDLTNNQMKDIQKTALDLGKELGKSSVDIMKSMAEFGRVNKNTDEIKELAKVAVMASNVTSLISSVFLS